MDLREYERRLNALGIGIRLVGVDPEIAAQHLKKIERTTRKALHAVKAEGAKRDHRDTPVRTT